MSRRCCCWNTRCYSYYSPRFLVALLAGRSSTTARFLLFLAGTDTKEGTLGSSISHKRTLTGTATKCRKKKEGCTFWGRVTPMLHFFFACCCCSIGAGCTHAAAAGVPEQTKKSFAFLSCRRRCFSQKKKLLKRNNGIASGMIVHRPFCLLDKIVIRSTMRFVVVVAGSFQNPCNWTEPASIAYYSYPRLTPKLDAHYQTSHFALWAAFVTIFFLFFGYLSSSFRSRTQLLPLCNQPVRVSFFPRDLSFLLTAKNGSEISILFLLSLIRVLRNQHTYLQDVSTTVRLCSWKNKRFCICFHGDS